MRTLAKTAIVLVALSAAAEPSRAHDHHAHESFSAGEPGDPNKPSRTIEVLLNEMDFTPARIEVARGEPIRFVLRNAGTEDHEFLLASTAENLKHAAVMKRHPHMAHDDPNGVRLAPKKAAEILWKFTKAGTFEYACLIPGHRDFGMTGHVTVK